MYRVEHRTDVRCSIRHSHDYFTTWTESQYVVVDTKGVILYKYSYPCGYALINGMSKDQAKDEAYSRLKELTCNVML